MINNLQVTLLKLFSRFNNFDTYIILLLTGLFASYFLSNKFVFEGGALFVAFLLLSFSAKFIFIILYLILSLINPDSIIANVTIIYYILSLEFVMGRVQCGREIKLNYLLLLSLSYVLFIAIQEVFQGVYRPMSIFSGPLALGYYLVSLSIILMVKYKKNSAIFFFLPLISGSRSVSLLLLPFLNKKNIKSFLVIFPFIAVLISFYLWDYIDLFLRSLSFNSSSDSGRFNSWSNFLNLNWDVKSVFFGFGRFNFGSLGLTLGNYNSVVIESSVLVFIASYGVFLGFIWFSLFLFFSVKHKSLIWLFFLFVSLFSVFHDSLGILLLVLISFSFYQSDKLQIN